MADDLNGRYAFRFNGFDDAGGASFFLLGVGVIDLDNGLISGSHRSATMPFANGTATAAQVGGRFIEATTFTINGSYKPIQAGIWMISAEFACTRPRQTMRSTFAFVRPTPGTLWLASHSSEVADPKGKFHKVAEMAMGEAVRIGDVPARRKTSAPAAGRSRKSAAAAT